MLSWQISLFEEQSDKRAMSKVWRRAFLRECSLDLSKMLSNILCQNALLTKCSFHEEHFFRRAFCQRMWESIFERAKEHSCKIDFCQKKFCQNHQNKEEKKEKIVSLHGNIRKTQFCQKSPWPPKEGVSERYWNKYIWTLRLYDWIGPVGQFSENSKVAELVGGGSVIKGATLASQQTRCSRDCHFFF